MVFAADLKRWLPILTATGGAGIAWASYGGGNAARAKVYDGPETFRRLSVEWWDDRWSVGQTSWRNGEKEGVPLFKRNIAWVERGLDSAGEAPYAQTLREVLTKGHRALIPLAGDTALVVFLAEQGLDVVAVEGSPEAVGKLQARLDGLAPEVTKRITILNRDFFTFLETDEAKTPFDFIYDRGSIVAIDPARRGEYMNIINAVTKPGTACYLEGIMRSPIYTGKQRGRAPPSNIDHAPYKKQPNMVCGPPHHLPVSQVKQIYDEGRSWRVAIDDESVGRVADELSDNETPFARYRVALERL